MSTVAVTLRPAALEDVDAIVAIERSAFSDPWSTRSFRELIGRSDVAFEVAEMPELAPDDATGDSPVGGGRGGASLVGFAIIYLADFEGDLANLATAKHVRRQGVGRALLRHALSVARARGGRIIFLEVRASNSAARALYADEGFFEVGRRSKYYARPVEDALILRKELE